MVHQYVREPLTQDDADKLGNACNSIQEKLILWPLLDCGLHRTVTMNKDSTRVSS